MAREQLRELLMQRLSPGAAEWLRGAIASEPREIPRAFSRAARMIGKTGLDRGDLVAIGMADAPCAASDLVRAVLLDRAVSNAGPEGRDTRAIVQQIYDDGDSSERAAVLRTLGLLPFPELFLPLAVDACRTHVLTVFEAIACDNVYPARYFPELAFNQMALKAAFVELSLSRLRGLDARRTPELDRMARAYAGERTLAGRSVPPDLSLLMIPERTYS